MEMKKKKGCMLCGASTTPQIDVNTASDITLGFSKERKSPTELSFEPSIRALYFSDLDCNTFSYLLKVTYFTFGKSSNEWNGGGELNCHSKVVAPLPHGFFCAFRDLMYASSITKTKKKAAKTDM